MSFKRVLGERKLPRVLKSLKTEGFFAETPCVFSFAVIYCIY